MSSGKDVVNGGPEAPDFEPAGGFDYFLVLLLPALVIVYMLLWGWQIGIHGLGSFLVAVVFSIIGAIITVVVLLLIVGICRPEEESPASTITAQSCHDASPTWRRQLRAEENSVHLALQRVEQRAAERPEFTQDQRDQITGAVRRFARHAHSQRHITEDAEHPDHAMVAQEMEQYRQAVLKVLRLRSDEIAAEDLGGFSYRQALRDTEGMVEALQDQFEELHGGHADPSEDAR